MTVCLTEVRCICFQTGYSHFCLCPSFWVLYTIPEIYKEAMGHLLSFHESVTYSDSGSGMQLWIKIFEQSYGFVNASLSNRHLNSCYSQQNLTLVALWGDLKYLLGLHLLLQKKSGPFSDLPLQRSCIS